MITMHEYDAKTERVTLEFEDAGKITLGVTTFEEIDDFVERWKEIRKHLGRIKE